MWVVMKAILRIFRYARKRLIKLSLENKMLKTQLEYYRAIIESDSNRKHQMVKKKSRFRHISINKKKFYFYEIKWWDILGDSGHAGTKEFDLMIPFSSPFFHALICLKRCLFNSFELGKSL